MVYRFGRFVDLGLCEFRVEILSIVTAVRGWGLRCQERLLRGEWSSHVGPSNGWRAASQGTTGPGALRASTP